MIVMQWIQKRCPKRKIKRVIGLSILLALVFSISVLAAGNGANQWPSGRIGYRLDTHYGQVAANAPSIPLYSDAACTQQINHYLLPGDWVVAYFNSDGSFTGAVTYPITVAQTGGDDVNLEFTTHYIPAGYLPYIVSGTGSFSGTDWNQDTWWNQLPSNISYTSKIPGNGDTVWVGNSSDGGVGGGFNIISVGNGYYKLMSGDWIHTIMSASPSQFCYYDSSRSDYVNADYSWNLTSQPWSTVGLHQGSNLISFAGMDASGNYATGQRWLKWDTLAPIMATNLTAIQNSSGHTGWLNLADFNSDENVIIISNEDTSQTNDVSGLNPASLQTYFDGTNHWGNSAGYQGFDSYTSNNGTKYYSLRSVMQAMGVQADGTGGQGSHSYMFSSIDQAWNTAAIGNSVQIDTIPPTCTASTGAASWQSGSSPITLNYSDNMSGMAVEWYRWSQSATDNGPYQGYSAGQQLTPPGDGTWYLHWYAQDVAGNTSSGVFGPYSNNAGMSVVVQQPNAAYLTNEDVISSATVADNSATPVIPDNSATVTLTVKASDGSTYTTQAKPVVVPSNDQNLIWFRWHTPPTAGTYTITAAVTVPGITPQSSWTNTISVPIKDETENTPPMTGLKDQKPSYFSPQTPNSSGYSSSLSWNEWEYTGGAFQKHTYTAKLNASLKINPTKMANGDLRIVTAYQNASGQWVMKSGYGINENVSSNVSVTSPTGSVVDPLSTTSAQLTEGRYPEFNYWYAGYFRLFENLGSGNFDLQANKYSQYGFHSHYTPIWFPDGPYTVLTTTSQAWTPAGMLGNDQTGTIQIQGSLPQDWYVREYPYQ
ncbi:hypothetical protein [Ethanoligenens sp.]|uniref:hypothetical protein n=1 Tax=Ethanoligenens sp. TaxID=2099655 RepID=UPI0039EA226E